MMDIQQLIALLIVTGAAASLGLRFWRQARGGDTSCGGCGGACGKPAATPAPAVRPTPQATPLISLGKNTQPSRYRPLDTDT